MDRKDKKKENKVQTKRIPVGTRFSSHFQTGPGTHSASYETGTSHRVSFSGVKRPGRIVNHTHLHLVSRLKKSRAVPLPLSGPSWPVLE
jgi:hypothetical protein